jgi:D-Tyr-tRNAtyr deacylase
MTTPHEELRAVLQRHANYIEYEMMATIEADLLSLIHAYSDRRVREFSSKLFIKLIPMRVFTDEMGESVNINKIQEAINDLLAEELGEEGK